MSNAGFTEFINGKFSAIFFPLSALRCRCRRRASFWPNRETSLILDLLFFIDVWLVEWRVWSLDRSDPIARLASQTYPHTFSFQEMVFAVTSRAIMSVSLRFLVEEFANLITFVFLL